MSGTPTSKLTDWVFDEQAFLKKIPYPLTPTNLKGAYAGTAPSDDFDPNTASAAELVKNGILWRRPTESDHPAHRALWKKVFSRKWLAKDRITPVLEPQVGKRHDLRTAPRKISDGSFLTYSWAGAATSSGGPYGGVAANWIVPTVSKPSEPASSAPSYDSSHGVGWDSSSWCGIDGYFVSNDVLQAGVQQYIQVPSNKAVYVAWYEWYGPIGPPPAYVDQVNIGGFPVKPGDELFVYVSYVGKTSGSIYFGNNTTGQHVSLTLAPPTGVSFNGSTVEWIMEDPDGGEQTNTALAKFTPVVFTSAIACNASGVVVNNPQTDDTVNIETTGGKVLTSVTLGNDTATIDFIG
jgi:Peptidase A4 family